MSYSTYYLRYLNDTCNQSVQNPHHVAGLCLNTLCLSLTHKTALPSCTFTRLLSICCIPSLHLQDTFPYTPPFVRVVKPHMSNGYVLTGGAICMELLTPKGWSSAYTVEAVILQIAATFVKGKGRIIFGSSSKVQGLRRMYCRRCTDAYNATCSHRQASNAVLTLVSIPPFPLTKLPQQGWSSIFGPIPWLSPSQIILAKTMYLRK